MSRILTLNKEEQEARKSVYTDIETMIEVKNRKYPQLAGEDGERTPKAYWEDSDRRLNGTTLSRDSQGKDDWQSNVFNPVTRSKLRAFVAGVALSVPETKYRAINANGVYSVQRAELVKQLVRHSRQIGNPAIDIFFEAWEMAGKGTVIKYDGYIKTKYKRKIIKSYDLTTGEVEFDTREEIVDDHPIDELVPLEEIFWWDMFTYDIQKQRCLARIKHYDAAALEEEFGQYKNFKHIKDASGINTQFESETKSYFYDRWAKRVEAKDDYEVIFYYNKFEDRYEIWCNGVPLLRAPMLWGRRKKIYPFSKSIFEPFDRQAFFLGKSFPSVIEGMQDTENTALNSTLDKMWRSLYPPMLVGLGNKDLLDLEEELVNQDNRVYVPDVNQVKPMPFMPVNSGDTAMLTLISRKTDLASIDPAQQGVSQNNTTARATVIADENARRLKGTFFTFLEDLWRQKTRVRIENVIMNYTLPKYESVVGQDGAKKMQEALRMFHVTDTTFSDGSKGVLGIQVASTKSKLMSPIEMGAREDAMKEQGINYKVIGFTSDYLDDWDMDFELVTESLFNQDKLRKQAEVQEKLQGMASFFPERFVTNKDKLFEDFVDIYDESPDSYKPAAPPAPSPAAPGGPGGPNAGGPGGPEKPGAPAAPSAPSPLDIGAQLLQK